MRVVQASFYRDPQNRSAEELLDAWPTVTAVAHAASLAGVDVQVVQAHPHNSIARNGLVHFSDHVVDEICRIAPDVVHVSGLQFGRFTRELVSRMPHLRVVVQNRGGHAAARWRRPWIRFGLNHVHGVMFTAREQAQQHNGALPRHVPVFEVVGSSTHFRDGDQFAARHDTGMSGEPCVVWVGRLNANKDPLTALKAIRLAAQELECIQLWCCFGSTDMLADVKHAIAADRVLQSRVKLLGHVEHTKLEHVYRAADFFISCSYTESSGFALVEAIACGLSPIVSDIPSFRKITGNGAIGELVPPGDARGFADALIRQHRARTPRDAVRAHFEDKLSFERMGRDLRGVYEAVLA